MESKRRLFVETSPAFTRITLGLNSCQTEPNDFEDEDDVGLTLTLPDSETDLFVPEPDEVQTDEDEEYYDDDSPEVWRVMKVVPWMSDDYHQDVPQQQPLLSRTLIGRSEAGNEAGSSRSNGTEALNHVLSRSQMNSQFTSTEPQKGNRIATEWTAKMAL